MPNRIEHTRSTEQLIADGLQPHTVAVPASLYDAFFQAAWDALRKGAPGIAEPIRATLARSIAMKCERAAKQQERAA